LDHLKHKWRTGCCCFGGGGGGTAICLASGWRMVEKFAPAEGRRANGVEKTLN